MAVQVTSLINNVITLASVGAVFQPFQTRRFEGLSALTSEMVTLDGQGLIQAEVVAPDSSLSTSELASLRNLLRGSGRILARRGNLGMRLFGGRMETPFNDGGTAKTHHCVVSTARHFDAVQVVLSAANAAPVPVTKIAVAAMATAADLNNSAGTWVSGTFAGSAAGSIGARAAARRRSYLISDRIDVSSVPRSDGGAWPLLGIRAFLGTAGTYTMLGNSAGSDSFVNWATKPDGRIHVMRYNNGDCIATPASFTDTTNRNTSPIIGIIYYSRGRVVNVGGFGDSIQGGRGTYKGDGWGFSTCQGLTEQNDIAYEWSNLAWDGSQMNDTVGNGGHVDMLADALAAGLPIDIALLQAFSPNDYGANISDALITSETARPLARMWAECRSRGVSPIVMLGLPVSTSIKDWNADDARRVAWNQTVKAMPGLHYVDIEPIFSGPVDADGQVGIVTSKYADGIHPSDEGNADVKSLLAPEIASYF